MPLTLVLQSVSPQPDIWHDPLLLTALGIIATLLAGLIGAFAAYWIYRKQQVKKEITYQRISEAPIVTVNKDVASRVDVLLDGKPTKGVRLLVFEVKNVGSSAVKGEDYFEPVTFHFDGEVVGGEVLKTQPKEFLEPSQLASFLTFKERALQLSTCPLNPGDAITFSVFIEGEGKADVRGRINTGTITEFDPVKERERQQRRLKRMINIASIVGTLLLAPEIIYILYLSFTGNGSKPVVISGVFAFMLLGGLLLGFIAVGMFIFQERLSQKK